jgi:transmembrane sensor
MLPPTVDWEILTRYLAGETTEAENREVEAWEGNSASNKQQLEQLRKIWQVSETPAEAPESNPDLAWNRIAAKINAPAQPMRVAEELPEKSSFNVAWVWRIAAAAVLVLGVALAFYKTRPALQNVGLAMVKFETKAGQRSEVTLPDGSKVWLNEKSVLRYPKQFAANSREITLEGEAFFDVTKNPEKPFRITAGETVTEVKGTSFNVEAYDPGKAVTVAVVTGKVQLREKAEPENQVLLTPNQTGNFDGEKVTSEATHDLNFMAWKTGVLRFEDADLKTVTHDLEKQYGKTVRIREPKLENCHFTGSFEKQKLEEVLEVLRLTLNLQAEEKDKGIELTGEGCK